MLMAQDVLRREMCSPAIPRNIDKHFFVSYYKKNQHVSLHSQKYLRDDVIA